MDEEIKAVGRPSRPETIAALVHYYRAEVTRSLAWRERLDRTTNWAVGSVAAFLGFAFSHPEIHHSLFFFALAIVYTLLLVEARRYRFFDAYEYRVRLMNQYFFYGLLTDTFDMAKDSFWVAELASDLRHPQYKVGFIYALGRRFKANYVYLFAIVLAAWLLKIKIHPTTARSWFDYLNQAALGEIPGWVTFLFILLFVGHAAVLQYIGSKPLGGRDLLAAAPREEEETRPEHD